MSALSAAAPVSVEGLDEDDLIVDAAAFAEPPTAPPLHARPPLQARSPL